MKLSYSFYCLIILSVILSACNKPDDIGFEILPANDIISTEFCDSSTIFARTVFEDSLPSRGYSYQIIGSYTDPIFGFTKTSCYTQVNLTKSNYSFGTDSVADSLVLCLSIKDYYGDTLTPVHFKVYRLDENINSDSTYWSNKTFIAKTKIGEATIALNPHDSASEYGIKKAPHIRIKLNNDLAEELISQGGTANFLDNNSFIKYFKGLYITADAVTGTGQGYLLSFDYKNALTKLSLYYHNADTDSVSLNFIMDDKCRVNNFKHDYTGSEVGLHVQQSDSTISGADAIYLQSMAGVKSKVYFPYLKSFGKTNWVINKAELIIKCDNSDPYYPSHTKIAVAGVDSLNKPYTLQDSQDGVNVNDGIFNAAKKEYRYNITRYVQHTSSGNVPDHGLYLLSTGAVVNMYRTKLLGFNSPLAKMRLEINYSVF